MLPADESGRADGLHAPGSASCGGVAGILKEAQAGVKLADLVRKHGISEGTFHRWKARFGGMEVSDARRLRQLEDENRRLKSVVADLTLDNQALKAVLGKRW